MSSNDLVTLPSSVLSPFRACLQHLHVLDQWAGFAYWNKGRSEYLWRIAKFSWRCSGFSFFVLFSLFVPFYAICYTRLNHKHTQQTQITYGKINCVLKDSSCDTPLPTILMLVILATCASSSSTKSI
ncbi:hypothetical protein H5410_030683 [Solanum commersonii]|uniref:Uncharacterized protein n=1 Tax=Solanum commersonii TaxID=4109 RepID=A0A9J5YGE6_SOLCO|nr:hypothetical protein H5410_030683 [Solanum commersonii]